RGVLRGRGLRKGEEPIMLPRQSELATAPGLRIQVKHPKRIAKTRVARKRSVAEPALDGIVVDEQRFVLLVDPSALQRAVGRQMVAGAGTLDVLRKRFT